LNGDKPGSTIDIADEVIIDNTLVTIKWEDLNASSTFIIEGKLKYL
jgi:hypothetical protein